MKRTITVSTFKAGTPKDAALKPLEEAAEVYGAWQRIMHPGKVWPSMKDFTNLADEIADTIQACVNLADRCGIDLDSALERVEKKNHQRGRC